MRRSSWLALAFLALLGTDAMAAPEYSIKAGYILLFTRYVEWPDHAFASPNSPIQVCVLGEDPFGSVLDRTLAGQHSQQRALAVQRVSDASSAARCHVAFIGRAEPEQRGVWIAELAGRPVLTICEHPDALRQGAVLAFVGEMRGGDSRIRFDANLQALQRAGLKARSQMLVAARKVHREEVPDDRDGSLQ